jgi:hypothetical protein
VHGPQHVFEECVAVWALGRGPGIVEPGNPLENPEGRRPPPEVEQAMKQQYNLDSFWNFYGSYLESASGVRWVRDELSGRAAAEVARAIELDQAPPTRRVFDLGPSLQYRDQRAFRYVQPFA